ncbi:MAG: DEAD/DEAH box helicase [Chlamydiae bacterium]|nr:DEAD/DEAH box helicase [Chlamydiota bacterium]
MKYLLVQGNDPKKVAFGLKEGEKTTWIASNKSMETLRALTAKGELGFGSKRILLDPFVSFKVLVELHGCQVHPFFVYKSQKIPFHVCPLILSDAHDLFIYEGIIREFHGSFPNIRRFFGPIVTLTSKELADFKDSYLVDPPDWGPSVVVVQEHIEKVLQLEEEGGECCIQLTDDSGAFIHVETKNCSKEASNRFFQDIKDAGYTYKPMGKSSYYCPTHDVRQALALLHGMGYKVIGPNRERVLFESKKEQVQLLENHSLKVSTTYSTLENTFHLTDALDAHGRGRVILKSGTECLFLDMQELDLFHAVPHKIEQNQVVLRRFWALEIFNRLDKKGVEGLVELKNITTPNDFKGSLFEFQQEGLNWLMFQYANGFTALLADEMGLGKTVQTIAFLSVVLAEKDALIIAPLTLLTQWKKEIEKFNSSLSVHIYNKKNQKILPGITLISYQMLRSCIDTIEGHQFEVLILDEAQSLRNRKTKGHDAVGRVEAGFKIALSGTPIENHVLDLVNLFSILLPDLVLEIDVKDLDRIKTVTKPFILRRLKKDVLKEMPQKMEQLIYIDLYSEQKEAYDELKKNLVEKMREDASHIFALMTKLRQHALSPRLVDQPIASAKLDLVLDDLTELVESGHKVLLFSHFASLLNILEVELQESNISYFYLDGQTKHRDQVVEAFKKHEGGCVFLMTLKTGGVGLNLVEADTVMIFEPWWNPQLENQAIDRAHRVGREKPLMARRYVVLNTIEEHIEKIKKEKKELADNMIEEGEVSQEILQELLERLL